MIENNPMSIVLDKILGSMVGGAIGDALGYTVEFVPSYEEIEATYGAGGIREYDTNYPWFEGIQHKALVSDDTQMTLYTAEGLIYAIEHNQPIVKTISDAYLYWYGGQTGWDVKSSYPSELAAIFELNQRRAPGNTCLSALSTLNSGKKPDNNSKGCGGIMRIAPIALYGANHNWPLQKTAKLAGEVAEITHLHPMSTLSSACCAAVIQLCVMANSCKNAEEFGQIVNTALDCIDSLYKGSPYMEKFRALIGKALQLRDNHLEDWQIIENALGGGWVAEETLAIAIFSVARHIDSFEECVISAVNHGGDSDSTGAVAGNIIGAILGYKAIPENFINRLQLHDLITSTAVTLYPTHQ